MNEPNDRDADIHQHHYVITLAAGSTLVCICIVCLDNRDCNVSTYLWYWWRPYSA